MLFKFYSRFEENKDLFKYKRCEAARENIGSWINGAKEKKKEEALKGKGKEALKEKKERAEPEKNKAEKRRRKEWR